MRKLALVSVLLTLLFSQQSQAFGFDKLDTISNNIATHTQFLKPSVLKLAIQSYYSAQHQGISPNKSIITVIDYSLPCTTKRLWVVDLDQQKVLYSSLVAHGKYSGELYTTKFSNAANSHQTSLGLFLTENTYFGRDGYSLRLKGLEKDFNDKAESRAIVMHGAWYVSEEFAKNSGRIGKSWGCPAVQKELATPIINTIKDGTLVFAYYPDKHYLQTSKFLASNYQA
jgi:hypothetical protein